MMITGQGQATILSVSIGLQLAAAVIALLMIRRSGVYLPWALISSAIVLMTIRRIISLANLLEGDLASLHRLLPEVTALVISILMLAGLVLFRPAFDLIREQQETVLAEVKEQTLFASETRHHTKNDFALLQSLVSLQEMHESDPGRREFLADFGGRIRTMALLHERLHDVGRADSILRYVSELVDGIRSSYGAAVPGLRIDVDVEDAPLERSQLIHCGLIISEALTNSVKYAFDGVPDPTVSVPLTVRDGRRTLEIRDNGRGLPDEGAADGFGTSLMRGISDMEGWTFVRQSDAGARVVVTLGESA